jgi:hypothetical protein
MSKTNLDAKSELLRLYENQSKLSHELSRLNIAAIDAARKVKMIDKEIGSGYRRYDELQAAKDEFQVAEKLRNKKNAEFFAALEEYEHYHQEIMPQILKSCIAEFESLQPLHNEVAAKVTRWRDNLNFVSRFYVPRSVRKEYGFIVTNGRKLPVSIFEDEDTTAVELLKNIVEGNISISDKKLDIYSQVSPRRRGAVYA